MRVLVCGGRSFENDTLVYETLDKLHRERGISTVITGDATGVDTFAARWADSNVIPCVIFAADWYNHGKAAGPMRNGRMLRIGEPDFAIAFPGGKGTADMTARLRAAKVELLVVKECSCNKS